MVMAHRRDNLGGEVGAGDYFLAFLAMPRHLESLSAGRKRHVAHVVQERRRAKALDVTGRDI